ncbi:MAG: ATP-binding protein [Bacteroidia bacterium]|nr:ATP-binding protein [Bacteroidia bacterium]
MNSKRIVITGGPGTGKTSIINELIKRNFSCLEEISRQVTLDAKKKGISQLFLTDPLLFSDLLLEGRTKQFQQAGNYREPYVFIDRGIPDVLAYMDYIGTKYPQRYDEACKNYKYDHVFILAPWQEIYVSDNERYESFDQAIEIHEHLLNTYSRFDYELHDVPFGSVEDRTDFILKIAESL